MNTVALIFLVVSATAIIALPRKWALIPLLASCCYMTTGQSMDIGPISLPMYRIILAVGLLRVIFRRETVLGGANVIDKLMMTWAAWVMFASLFHERLPGAGPVYALGFVGNIMLIYLLVRVWCRNMDEMMAMLRMLAWLLVPIAVAMLAEHHLKRNLFGVLGGVSESVFIRDGVVRAQGPFAHPILAGTVGAVCLPLLLAIWRRYRISAFVGLVACIAIVLSSSSSGPLMSLIFGVIAILMWPYRASMSLVRWALLGAYASAELLMTRPAYYLISKFDLTGSSTGWYRSRLIEVAFDHFAEWWAFGTDYTAHWMPFQPPLADGRHSDIPNYYLLVGITGGFPAMLLMIAIISWSFVLVGRSIRIASSALPERGFMIWCLGAGLLAHATTSISVAYTDQSMMFFWLNVGVISSVYGVMTQLPTAKLAPNVTANLPRLTGFLGPKASVPRPGPRPSIMRRDFHTGSSRASHRPQEHRAEADNKRASGQQPTERQ